MREVFPKAPYVPLDQGRQIMHIIARSHLECLPELEARPQTSSYNQKVVKRMSVIVNFSWIKQEECQKFHLTHSASLIKKI
jgi:hypothetical protein